MKVGIIGSTGYQEKMAKHKEKLEKSGYEVRLPMFDGLDPNTPNVEYIINVYNRELIEWADEIHLFWDQRSAATLFDAGMVFMLRKPLVNVFLETKLFSNFFRQYEIESHEGRENYNETD